MQLVKLESEDPVFREPEASIPRFWIERQQVSKHEYHSINSVAFNLDGQCRVQVIRVFMIDAIRPLPSELSAPATQTTIPMVFE